MPRTLLQTASITVAAGVALAALATDAQAQYVDPGTGSIIIQAVIAGLVGVAAVVRLYWGRISGWLARRSENDEV